MVLESQGKPELAADQYRAALRARETSNARANAHSRLGFLALRSGRADTAVYHLQAAIELDRYRAMNHYLLGAALEAEGRTQGALNSYINATRLRADFPEANAAIERLRKKK